ncbi:hypothetical protein QUF90_04345 [Desulfococcaceae bacterium HSG9]|nr:hypothetical protein [Desulfococcaceae bacterium HSG9]
MYHLCGIRLRGQALRSDSHRGGTRTDKSVIKDMTAGIDGIFFYTFRGGIILNPAYETFPLILKTVKKIMALTAAIHNAGLSRGKNPADKRTFGPFPGGQEYRGGNPVTEIRPEMSFGFP